MNILIASLCFTAWKSVIYDSDYAENDIVVNLLSSNFRLQLFWLFVLFGNNVVDLYIGRIFAGSTGGGMYICLPLFVAEIADQRWEVFFMSTKHAVVMMICILIENLWLLCKR